MPLLKETVAIKKDTDELLPPKKTCSDRVTIIAYTPILCVSDSAHEHAIRVYYLTGELMGHIAAEEYAAILEDYMIKF